MTIRLAVAVALLPAFAVASDPDPLPAGAFARLGSTAWHHPEQPHVVAVHPTGKTVASGGADGTVRIWDVATGKTAHTIRRAGASVAALAHSPDGKWLAVHFSDETARVYDTGKYAETNSITVKNADAVALSGDGKLLLAAGPLGQPSLLEIETGQDRLELPKGRAAALFPDGDAVAVATDTDRVQVLEIPSGKPRLAIALPKDTGPRVTHLAVHPLAKRIAVATGGLGATAIHVYDFGKEEPRFTVTGEGPVAFLGETALVGRLGGKLAVWDGTTGKLVRSMGDGVTTLAVSPDGRVAATDGGAEFPSPRIHLWDVKTGAEINRRPDEVADIRGLVPHPAGGLAVLAGGRLLTWTPGDPKPVTDLDLAGVRAVAPFGKSLVVVTGTDKLLGFGRSEKPFATVPPGVRFVAADARAKVIATATSGETPELVLVNAPKGEVIRKWPLPNRPLAVALDPVGERVAVLGRDGYARVWATSADGQGKTPPELWKERMARSFRGGIAFSPDGTRVAFTSLMRVSVHEAATGKVEVQFDRTWDDGPFTSLAFSPDGRFLAAGTQGTGGGAIAWELVSRQRTGRYAAGGTVTGVAFIESGRTLVTAGADDNLIAWDRTGRRGKSGPTADELAAAWHRLGDVTPETAYPATATFAAGGKATLGFLAERLTDEKKQGEMIRQWVTELGSREFAVREAATKELAAVGGPVLPVLDEFAKTPRSAEWTQRARTVRGRIQMAAEALPDPALVGVPLRWLRVVAAVEAIADPAATAALEAIRDLGGAAGADAARVLKAREKR